MNLKDPLPITPFTMPAHGEVTLPGSKSITNRALLLAALCYKPVQLQGALFSEDTQIMAKALNDLGLSVSLDESKGTMLVGGQENGFKQNKRVELFVGNAGTAARFLTALCAAAPQGTYELDGVPQMHRRPMKGLIDALRTLGAEIKCLRDEGFLPIEIRAKGLRGGKVPIDASESSQMLSALVMVLCRASQQCEIYQDKVVRAPFVNMTLLMMRQFGFDAGANFETRTLWTMPSEPPRSSLAQAGGSYLIEADASSASYFLALPIATKGGTMTLTNMPFPKGDPKGNLQGDGYNFIEVMKKLGASVRPYQQPQTAPLLNKLFSWMASQSERSRSKSLESEGVEISYDPSRKQNDKGTYVKRRKGLGTQEFREFSDTFLTLAAITPLLSSEKTIISGIAHTKKQETDRINAMATELAKIIGSENIRETPDSIEVSPLNRAELAALKKRIKFRGPIQIETYNDHRVAMSFAILGCHDLLKNGKPWIEIKNPLCCAKTFPNFFELLESVRQQNAKN